MKESQLASNPILQFQSWFRQARRLRELKLPEAMCLSTANSQGNPTARMVLLKEVDAQGFSFFTNIHSPKAKDLLARRKAALTFYWEPLRRQVRIEGKVVRLSKQKSDAYFATRSRASQIGSWASQQSQLLMSREVLLARFRALEAKFRGRTVPAPPHWQGFQLQPLRIEFWQERPNRLHDRWVYVRKSNGRWLRMRLYP